MKFTFTVIGAGVVGLAIARRLAEEHRGDNDVLVVEKERTFGMGTSSRNSEVIHSGIYYPQGSLKHRLCVQGRRLLYGYSARNGIPHKKCGKLVIATAPEEEPVLDGLYRQAAANGVENVERLTGPEALLLEPDIRVHSALFVKETGIIDCHSLMKSFVREIQKNNGIVQYNAPVASIRRNGPFEVALGDGTVFSSGYVINAAGLYATSIAETIGMKVPRLYPCKGVYFSYSGDIRCSHLVYPVPEKKMTGLGVHATIDLGGRLRFGPDAEYCDCIDDYCVSDDRKDAFFRAAQKIFPALSPDYLHPDMAGIRPKIQGPDDKEVKDFYIREESGAGYPRFINLIGIESPGLTSSMAIADHVYDCIKGCRG